MPLLPDLSAVNCILTTLPSKERKRFLSGCREIELTVPGILCEAGEHIRQVYFPIDSFISLLTPIEGSACLEMGLVGNEGMFGIPLVLGANISPFQALIQGSGSAWRMDAVPFRHAIDNSPALRHVLNRYAYVSMAQLGQTAMCAYFHLIEARLARSLLMTRDRAHSNDFYVTHESLANKLGVRRVGITMAAGLLKKQKLISYNRGHVTILNPAGLEASSCKCYQIDKETYKHMMT